MRQPLFPTLLDCAHFVSTTSVSTPSRSRTRLLLHIWVVIRLVTTNLDFPHFVCAHSVTHIFVACSTQSNRAHSLYYTFRFNPRLLLSLVNCYRKNPPYDKSVKEDLLSSEFTLLASVQDDSEIKIF